VYESIYAIIKKKIINYYISRDANDHLRKTFLKSITFRKTKGARENPQKPEKPKYRP